MAQSVHLYNKSCSRTTSLNSPIPYHDNHQEKLLQMYTAAKGWRMRKLKTTQHIIERLGISFVISSYNETQKVMSALEKQIQQIRDVADQLTIMKADEDGEHYRESVKFERDFQQMVHALFNIAHGQDVGSHDRRSANSPASTQAA